MKVALTAALTLTLAAGATLAQAPGPRGPARPPGPQAAPQPPAPPPIFPCRTAEEICYLGIVVNGQVAVLYTNAQKSEGIDAKPVDVAGPDGAKLDLAAQNGRAVMLTGTYDPKAGLTKAELVEVASPLASLAVKAQLAAPPEEPQAGKAPPKRR
ncbi:MAG: hypothetical protein JO048_14045 [Methylobacteriaceae bacterium]|nr:hypothetical protein [Methylobacteriaceae bacterium]